MARLNFKQIKALRAAKKLYLVADGRGLSICVHPSGLKSWCIRYRVDGRPAIRTIGHFPSLGVEEARARAEGLRPDLKIWSAAPTVQEFSERYLREIVENNRKDPATVRRYFERDIYPAIGQKAVNGVPIAELRTLIFGRREIGHFQAALALRDLLKRMWDYAVVCGVTSTNPVLAIPRKFIASAQSRSRALSPAEVGEFVVRLEDSTLRRRLKGALLLLLLTLVRKNELMLSRWRDIDLVKAEWVIPAENSKTSEPQVVYLSRQACALFAGLRGAFMRPVTPSEVVFHHLQSRTQPIAGATLNRALARVTEGMEHFTVHDLRRTAATLLAEAEYPSDIIEKALNHTIKGVRGVYNRAQFRDQRTQMLQEWADRVEDYGLEYRAKRSMRSVSV